MVSIYQNQKEGRLEIKPNVKTNNRTDIIKISERGNYLTLIMLALYFEKIKSKNAEKHCYINIHKPSHQKRFSLDFHGAVTSFHVIIDLYLPTLTVRSSVISKAL